MAILSTSIGSDEKCCTCSGEMCRECRVKKKYGQNTVKKNEEEQMWGEKMRNAF